MMGTEEDAIRYDKLRNLGLNSIDFDEHRNAESRIP